MKKLKPGWWITVLSLCLLFTYLLFCFSPILFYEPQGNTDANLSIMLTGHRGAGALAPENTLPAIDKALEMGVPRIEIDIHQSKDSVLLLMHDLSVDRTTDGKGLVRDLDFREIQTFHAGTDATAPPAHVPSLEEVLNRVQGKATLCIEVKKGGSYYPGIEHRLVSLIRQYEAENWVIVFSFSDEVLEKMQQIAPDINLLKLLVARFPGTPFGHDGSFGRLRLEDYGYVKGFGIYYPFVTQSIIDEAHSLGKEVQVWTVNDPVYLRRLAQLGVDGVITDDPGLSLK